MKFNLTDIRSKNDFSLKGNVKSIKITNEKINSLIYRNTLINFHDNGLIKYIESIDSESIYEYFDDFRLKKYTHCDFDPHYGSYSSKKIFFKENNYYEKPESFKLLKYIKIANGYFPVLDSDYLNYKKINETYIIFISRHYGVDHGDYYDSFYKVGIEEFCWVNSKSLITKRYITGAESVHLTDIESSYNYTYHVNNKLKKSIFESKKNYVKSEYDIKGRLIYKEVKTTYENEKNRIFQYVYNDNLLITKKDIYQGKEFEFRFKYKTDKHGNWITRSCFYKKFYLGSVNREITYYD